MKKKVLSIFLVMAMLVLVLTGCGLFSSNGNGEYSNNYGNIDYNATALIDGVPITEKFVLKAPEGLDYDQVYAMKAEPTGDNLTSDFNKENGMLALWLVTYAKGNELVGEYAIYVLPDQAGVDNMLDNDEGDTSRYIFPEEEPFVMMSFVDKDQLDANIILYQSFGELPDPCTPIQYADMNAQLFGGILVEE